MTQSFHYRSVADMNEVILRNLGRIPFDVDLIVGIPRSGLLAGTLISLYLNRPLTDLQGLREGRLLGKGKRAIPGYGAERFSAARRILVVDDCVSQGTEMRRAQQFIIDLGLTVEVTYLTVFSFPENPGLADITFEVIPRPMCFQWSFMHTPELQHYCLDIDGVICRDATKLEDDDGEKYRRFLREASPLFVPTSFVGWLVTSRLEKYRELTEEWLRNHGVTYGELVMMDEPSSEMREKSGRHITFKVETYKRTGAKLFIESGPGIAEAIARESGKPVLCMTSNRVIGNPEVERYAILVGRMQRFWRRVLRAPRALLIRTMALVSGGDKSSGAR